MTLATRARSSPLSASALAAGRREILAMLGRRGLRGEVRLRRESLLLPARSRQDPAFYSLLRSYAFRLLLRDVLVHREGFAASDLEKYCSREAARGYLSVLVRTGVARRVRAGSYRLARAGVRSFGDTLEWLVAQVLEREFGVPALGGVRIERLAGGGDCDVVALLEGELFYVETKAAPPRHLEARNVAAFLDRVEALRPAVAVFLEDTKLRMSDKLVPLFEEELARRFGARAPRLRRVAGEVFAAGDRLFLANSDPDLAVTLGICIERYLWTREAALPRRLPEPTEGEPGQPLWGSSTEGGAA